MYSLFFFKSKFWAKCWWNAANILTMSLTRDLAKNQCKNQKFSRSHDETIQGSNSNLLSSVKPVWRSINLDWRVLRDAVPVCRHKTHFQGSQGVVVLWDYWDYTEWAGLFLPFSCFTSLPSQALWCVFASFFCTVHLFCMFSIIGSKQDVPPEVGSVASASVPPCGLFRVSFRKVNMRLCENPRGREVDLLGSCSALLLVQGPLVLLHFTLQIVYHWY